LIGAAVFVIVFVLSTLISIAFPSLPPAETIINWVGISALGYEAYLIYIGAIVNGIIYGVAVWLAFSITNVAVKRTKKGKPEKVDFATCPKCRNIVASSKTLRMTTSPTETGKRTQMEIGLFDCPKCDKTFRRIVSKKELY
jgi:hypothetical protein